MIFCAVPDDSSELMIFVLLKSIGAFGMKIHHIQYNRFTP